jgi:hypothetical protein
MRYTPARSFQFCSLTIFYLLGASVGSYSDSPGIEVIRRHVADYIAKR